MPQVGRPQHRRGSEDQFRGLLGAATRHVRARHPIAMCPNWAAGRVQQCLPRHNVCGLSVHALHCDLCSSLQLRLHRLLRRLGRRHDRLATACGAAGGLQQPLPGCYLRRSAAPPVSNRLPIALPLPTDARCRCRLTADFHHVEDGSQYAYSCQEFITSLNCECTGCCAAPPSPPPAPAPPPPSPVPVACQKVCHDETCLSFRSTPCAILEAPPLPRQPRAFGGERGHRDA